MSTIKDGGPAFPREDYQTNGRSGGGGQQGMSLRDYFAANAVAPLIRIVQEGGKTGPDAADDDFLWVGRRAYLLADAMLAARERSDVR